MRRRIFSYLAASVTICVVMVAAQIGIRWQAQREWFALQQHQLQTINRLAEIPPPGWNPDHWRNAIVTPYNVWGNVTYTPSYSQISNQEMRQLHGQLEHILAETSPENSPRSVDRVFELLLKRGQKTEFISGYRDEFREGVQTYREKEARSNST